MSLIQDALKRKSEEPTALHSIGIPGGTPAIPENGKNPQALLIVLIILMLAGLIAALIGLSLYLIKPKVVQAVVPAPAAVEPAPEPAAVAEVPVQNIETAMVETVAEPVEAEPAPELKTAWPELTLTGIAQGDKSLAILNGKMLSAGRKLGEVTIIEVNARSIVVEYCGERRTLYIDE